MPFNMFKAAFSGSRNRAHRGDPAIYNDYPQGYPPGTDFPEPMIESQPRLLRRSSTKRREPVSSHKPPLSELPSHGPGSVDQLFTPLPSRTPTDAEDYNEGYIRVDTPEALMGGVMNARPAKIDAALPPLGAPLESPIEETLSEREHREHSGRLHDPSRLLDRPPLLQRAGSYHSGRGERLGIGPGDPIGMSHSQSSASDHTVDALRTPPAIYPNERVIPPLPRTLRDNASYVGQGSRSPTDIYSSSHPYEVARNVRSHHDRYGHEKEGPIYYIIPGGMNVIFQDEYGNEITRVGDFSGRSRPSRPGPFLVQDEHGRELYRYDGYERRSQRGHSEPQIVQVDPYPSSRRDRSYSAHNYRSDPSYRRGESYYDHYPDHREHRDHREKDHRDHRYRDRGYADYPNYSEHRDHRSYRDPDAHRDHGSYTRGHGGYREHSAYREHGGYREHGEHRPQGRSEIIPPGRVSSRASQRTYSQMPTPQQYPLAVPDDRRSVREYAASHTSMRHQEDEPDISDELQELHI